MLTNEWAVHLKDCMQESKSTGFNDLYKEVQRAVDETAKETRSIEQRNMGIDPDRLWQTYINECPGEVHEPTTNDWLSQYEPEDNIPF
jgi:hypothetical protein